MHKKKILTIVATLLIVTLVAFPAFAHLITSSTCGSESAGYLLWNYSGYYAHRGSKNYTYTVSDSAYDTIVADAAGLWGTSINMTKVSSGGEGSFTFTTNGPPKQGTIARTALGGYTSNQYAHTNFFAVEVFLSVYNGLPTDITRRNALGHEIGHAYGLNHLTSTSNSDKLMYHQVRTASSPVNQKDKDGMAIATQ